MWIVLAVLAALWVLAVAVAGLVWWFWPQLSAAFKGVASSTPASDPEQSAEPSPKLAVAVAVAVEPPSVEQCLSAIGTLARRVGAKPTVAEHLRDVTYAVLTGAES